MIKVYLNCPMVGRTRERIAETFALFRLVTLAYLHRDRDEVVFVNDAPTYELNAETYSKYISEQASLAMSADVIVTADNDYRDPIACILNSMHEQSYRLCNTKSEYKSSCRSSYFRVPEECVWTKEESDEWMKNMKLEPCGCNDCLPY